jgi:predicted Zn-dependent peptidase
MLFKGTEKRNLKQIKQDIEGLGGSLNGFTSEEFTCFLVKTLGKHLHFSFAVLADMVLNAVVPPDELEKERTVILEEIRMYRDLPGQYVMELLDNLLWPGQPLGMNLAGRPETVGKFTREDILNYKKRYYQCQNISVISCGKLEHQALLKEVEKIFGSLAPKEKSSFIKASCAQQRPQSKLFFKATEQSHLAIGLHGLSRSDPQRYALGLLNIILGGNMSSRLFNEVREERGLAYEIGSSLKWYDDSGVFFVHAGVDNRKVAEAVSVILKELEKPKKELATKDELVRAKEFFTGQFLMGLEDTLEHMVWLGEMAVALEKIYRPEEILAKINAVTLEDLRKVAKKIFNQTNLNLAVVAPLKDKAAEEVSKRLALA